MKCRRMFFATASVAVMVLVCSMVLNGQAFNKTYVKGVVLSSGKPARSVWVMTSQNGRERGRSLTGDDGRYYLSNLDPGNYDVVVQNGKAQLFKGRITLPRDNTFNIRIR